MKKIITFVVPILFIFSFSIHSQNKPQVSFEDLILSAEEDFSRIAEAKKLTAMLGIPHSIYTADGKFLAAIGTENNQPVYALYNNPLNIYEGGEVLFYQEISSRFDLSEARLHYVNRETTNPHLGIPEYEGFEAFMAERLNPLFLMIPESTNDAVMIFDAFDGTLIDPSFIPPDATNLSTPINAIINPSFNVFVSDQLKDHVVEYDTAGNFLGVLAGGMPDTIDNIRGIALAPDLGSVLVTVGSGANQDAVAQFDLSGNYLGNFISPNTSIMDSPFDILFRASDALVSASSSNDITIYDLNGNYTGDFAFVSFPEQVYEAANGNILVAGFSSPSGLYVFDASGNQLNYFSTITGLRGAYPLGNGNYLVTNGSGVYELDAVTGTLIDTEISGISARFIEPYDPDIVPVELTSFTASISGSTVELNWSTATELNNLGFEIQRKESGINGVKSDWEKIGFVTGSGTTTEPKNYSFTDHLSLTDTRTLYYRLKQIDFDGSFEYSETVHVTAEIPEVYSLSQNFPNPFNPVTTIMFSLPSDANVNLSVFNLIGEKVAEIINSDLPAGSHKINFDASDLTSGVYLYRLNASAEDGTVFTDTKKFTLLK
ncbi:MAG: hypothetical protein Kow0098_02900 [Ignavibacteriaceae bacterium]